MATACHPDLDSSGADHSAEAGMGSAGGDRTPERQTGPTGDSWSPASLYRYHRAGNMVLAAGIMGILAVQLSAVAPPWVGFLIFALPVSLATATIQAMQDARRSAGGVPRIR